MGKQTRAIDTPAGRQRFNQFIQKPQPAFPKATSATCIRTYGPKSNAKKTVLLKITNTGFEVHTMANVDNKGLRGRYIFEDVLFTYDPRNPGSLASIWKWSAYDARTKPPIKSRMRPKKNYFCHLPLSSILTETMFSGKYKCTFLWGALGKARFKLLLSFFKKFENAVCGPQKPTTP